MDEFEIYLLGTAWVSCPWQHEFISTFIPINAFLRLFFHLNLKTTKFTNDIAYVCTFQVLYMYTGVYHSCIVKHKSRCTFEAWIDLFWHIDFKMVKHYIHLVKHIDLNMQKNELTDFDKYMLKHKLTYFDIDPFWSWYYMYIKSTNQPILMHQFHYVEAWIN